MMPTKYLDSFWLLVKYLLISLGIALVLRGFIFIPMMVEGNSMNPLLDNRDMILVERLTKIKRFDVIVFQEGGITYIKRVIALPGEKLAYKKQQLYINDKPVKEY
ncbi:signal peptidase I, partial [Enterococcus cecorum]